MKKLNLLYKYACYLGLSATTRGYLVLILRELKTIANKFLIAFSNTPTASGYSDIKSPQLNKALNKANFRIIII